MRVRVSNVEAFRQWREDEEASVADLVAKILDHHPSEAMRAGTAFHTALEHAEIGGEYPMLHADGYSFVMPDCELELPPIREVRAEKRYGDLVVSGKLDALDGRRVDDHKTTGRFDPDRYLAGYSWRYYLDIFGADTFRWNVFVIREVGPRIYDVDPPQRLEQRRYPGLPMDCARLARDFAAFARLYLPTDFDALALPEAA